MKVFVVDMKNCIDMSHYETFFYKNIKEGNLSLCRYPVDSLDNLGQVRAWLTEEINRNPFRLSRGLVVFLIPRDLTGPLALYDYNFFVKIYLHEYLKNCFDNRFRYVCIFVDQTDQNRSNDKTYLHLNEVSRALCSDDPALQSALLPKPPLPEPSAFENTLPPLIDAIESPVLRTFYHRSFSHIVSNQLEGKDSRGGNGAHLYASMLMSCNEALDSIRHMEVSYFGGDLEEKIRTDLKLVHYICALASEKVSDEDFERRVSRFVSKDAFLGFSVNIDQVKTIIVTYRSRLSKAAAALSSNDGEREKIVEFSYPRSDHSGQFREKIHAIATGRLKAALSPSVRDLMKLDISDSVFSALGDLLRQADEALKEFCETCISEFTEFWRKSTLFETEDVNPSHKTAEQLKEEEQLAALLNHYSINDLPGYPAELQLQQQLDRFERMIWQYLRCIRAISLPSFLGTFVFALASVLCFYFGSSYTVFLKEQTWNVFGSYGLIVAILFLTTFLSLRLYYYKKIRGILGRCKKLVEQFFENYIKRAREFENNINAAMDYYCCFDRGTKESRQKAARVLNQRRLMWHQNKIMTILHNLRFFDTFIRNARAENETNVPTLTSFADDAMHSDFYQMIIFK